jgi:preprotein translocase subunit YajC
MIRKGTRVERLTKKVGQFAETGKVVAIHDEFSVEVAWDDGHESIVSKSAVTPLTEANRPHKDT